MACLSSADGFLSVACGLKTFISNVTNNESIYIDHTKLDELDKSESVMTEDVRKASKIQEDSEDLGLSLLCSDFSPCKSKFVFCTLAKALCVVDITTPIPQLLNIYQLSRGASKVIFTPLTHNIVVADKSGDVFLFQSGKRSGDLILGHLSMLLDVIVSHNEQYILTCDRDEKIRVSFFPNAYNIVAYCLGHTEFVSSIAFLPHDQNCLFSTSGDGTVRFWDYRAGSELNACNTSLLPSGGEESVLAAITDAVAIKMNTTTSIIIACVPLLNTCLVMKCLTDSQKQVQCHMIQSILLKDLSPWKLTNSCNSLIVWILLNCKDRVSIKALIYDTDLSIFTGNLPENVTQTLHFINVIKPSMTMDFRKNVLQLLFKQKFDNFQEYLKKKNARLLSDQPANKKLKA